MDTGQIIDVLNHNISIEHEAILLYLMVAYTSGYEEAEGLLEVLAREEMLHMKWLSHMVLDLGGTPDLTPPPPFEFAGQTPLEALKADIELEDEVIAEYHGQIAAIDDPHVQRLLRRLILDSADHARRVRELIAKWESETPEEIESGSAPSAADHAAIRMLNDDARGEYTAVLQYLSHSFATAHSKLSVMLEDKAIQEMKHLGWLSEEVADLGGLPDIRVGRLYGGQSPADMLAANIRDEQLAQEQYGAHIEAIEDPEIKELLTLIKGQEEYHEGVFQDLLDDVLSERSPVVTSAPRRSAPRLTVGSLLGQA